jgi:hypothetical protein
MTAAKLDATLAAKQRQLTALAAKFDQLAAEVRAFKAVIGQQARER